MALNNAERAAKAAGYPMPEGTDLISGGDDAIRAAGVNAYSREFNRPALTTSDSLDNLTAPGHYPIPSVAVAEAIGSPFGAMGGVYVQPSGWSGANGPILRQVVWAYTANYNQTRTRLSNGAFGSWDTGILRADLGTMVGNTMRLGEWLASSPAVYTSGRGAVAFTFDHGLTKFKAGGLPGVLAGYGWGYGLALNDSTLASDENSGASTADVLSWAGAEIWNHGYNHGSTTNEQTARTIVVQGKTALEARFGREVFGFIPAGVGSAGLAGFDGGSSPEMFATTVAGQMILEHHAVTTGYMGTGGVRRLDGTVQQGIGRFTMDAQTVQRIKLQINQAINDRVGIMFMCHPSLLDRDGYLTTAQLLEVLAYAREREQSGVLNVLSPGELVRADAGPPPATVAALAPVLYSSGVRDVTGLLINGWTAGSVTLSRTPGANVTVHFEDLDASTYTSSAVLALPLGFRPIYRPGARTYRTVLQTWETPALPSRLDIDVYGNIRVLPYTQSSQKLSGTITFATADAPPTSPPRQAHLIGAPHMDLATLTDEQLDARRIAVLTEQERRQRLAQLPEQLAGMARDAVAAGADPDALLEQLTAALTTPDQETPA